MLKENFEIVGGVEIATDIQKRIQTTGVRGLDFEKANELGVFQRIANLLSATHASIMAAYRIFGCVDYLLDQLKANKNEISREMKTFDKSFDKFMKFWTKYYAKNAREINYETENLYHRIMEWMQIPENWQLGGEQRTECEKEFAIRIKTDGDNEITFFKAELNHEIKDSKETWGVFCYNPSTNKQTSVHTDMDKASALMVAKRLSNDNPQNIYTASIIRDIVEQRTEIIPFKSFKSNSTIGKVINVTK